MKTAGGFDSSKWAMFERNDTFTSDRGDGYPCFCVGPQPGHAMCPCAERASGISPTFYDVESLGPLTPQMYEAHIAPDDKPSEDNEMEQIELPLGEGFDGEEEVAVFDTPEDLLLEIIDQMTYLNALVRGLLDLANAEEPVDS